jgi:hypothetical protein
MTIFGYTEVSIQYIVEDGYLYLSSTESEVVQQFLDALKKTIPSSDLGISNFSSSGKPFQIFAKDAGKRKRNWGMDISETYWWIIYTLCQDGWEPFSVQETSSHFRKVIA